MGNDYAEVLPINIEKHQDLHMSDHANLLLLNRGILTQLNSASIPCTWEQ